MIATTTTKTASRNQNGREARFREGPDGGGDAFAAFEAQPDGKHVAEDGAKLRRERRRMYDSMRAPVRKHGRDGGRAQKNTCATAT